MARWTSLAIVLFAVLCEVALSFRWTSPTVMDLTACKGSDLKLPFAFQLNGNEKVEKVYWEVLGQTIASKYRGTFTPGGKIHFEKRLKAVPEEEAAILIAAVRLEDVGYYTVKLNDSVVVHNASAYLSVPVPPQVKNGELTAQMRPPDQACALALSCGSFTNLGTPGVTVEWTNPAGQVYSSSRYEAGHFYLDLPGKALPGNYSCRVACQRHAFQCIPPKLRQPSVVHVSSEDTSRTACGDPDGSQPTDITGLQADLKRLQQEWETTRDGQEQKLTELEDQCQRVTELQRQVDGLGDDVQNVASQNVMNRLDNLEDELNSLAGTHHAPDPLLKNMTLTFEIQAPQNNDKGTTLRSLAVTDGGIFVAGNHEKKELFMASPGDSSKNRLEPLGHGKSVHSVAWLPGGRIAVTVDSNYIMVADFNSGDAALRENWLFTEKVYWGSAARSDDTLFVGARPDSDSGARVDIVSLALPENRTQVISTVLTHEATAELQCPDSLTLHGNDLYISDWCSHAVIVLHLDTTKFDVLEGPPYHADLMFYEPRMTAFDDLGNMYLATGGTVCGYQGDKHYSRGFCVVLITRDGGFKKVLEEGKDIYPYGVISTNSGIAVTWVDFTTSPHRSSIKGYTSQGADQ